MVSYVSPYILNPIILKLNVSCRITQLLMKLGEPCKHCFSILRLNVFTLVVPPLVKEVVITLILYDHVVHDHSINHHLQHPLSAPYSSRVPNNGPLRLEHTKSTLHILPSTPLFLGKPSPLLSYGIGVCLENRRPLRIDTCS